MTVRNRIRMIALLGAGLALSGPVAAADALPSAAATEITAPLTYTRVYADSAGVSHFREERLEFKAERAGTPAMHALGAGGGALLARLQAGAFEDWHTAPQSWYLVVVQGISEVTTSDGAVRRFGPGALLLLDDTAGKGHQTRAVGAVDHIALVIPATAQK
jgi:hypothetical protein